MRQEDAEGEVGSGWVGTVRESPGNYIVCDTVQMEYGKKKMHVRTERLNVSH